MILGVGVDLQSVEDLSHLGGAWDDAFFRRAFTPEERAQAMARADPLEYFAGRFALKEAVFKALGLDPDSVHLAQIAVLDDASGKPAAAFGPRLAPLVPAGAAVHVSLSHDAGRALAVAVIEAGPPAA